MTGDRMMATRVGLGEAHASIGLQGSLDLKWRLLRTGWSHR